MLKLVLASEKVSRSACLLHSQPCPAVSAHQVCQKELTAGILCPFAASSLRACSSCCLAVAVGDWMGAAAALCTAQLVKVCRHACSATLCQTERAAQCRAVVMCCICASQATSSCTLAHGRSVCTKRALYSKCTSDAGVLAGAHLAFPGEAFALGFSMGIGSLPVLPPSFALTSVALSRSFLGWKGMGGGGSACVNGRRLTVQLSYRTCPPDTGDMPVPPPSFDSASGSHVLCFC